MKHCGKFGTCGGCYGYFRDPHDLCNIAERELVDSDTNACEYYVDDSEELETEDDFIRR